jgi:nicotinate-nucleotide pyrophosphorylase (carboxylating)
MIEAFFIREQVKRALAEDLLGGDQTTEALFPEFLPTVAELGAKESLVVAGTEFFQAAFHILDSRLQIEMKCLPGTLASAGDLIATVTGDGRSILKGERTALNFMQRLSGIATLTRLYVKAISGTQAKIVDTRKTTPGFRQLEREAVRLGGGQNHRFNLGDLILIKDNHIALAGGIKSAIAQARRACRHPVKIEVEVKSEAELRVAISSEADIIMLDNMSIEAIKDSVGLIRQDRSDILIEVSGGVTLSGVSEIAACGVDLISVGALTHSAPAVDLSLNFRKART